MKYFELNCRIAMLCQFHRDLEKEMIQFHLEHMEDRQMALQDARRKAANNINTWNCRLMDKFDVSIVLK